MPDYGILDKSPEEIADEQFLKGTAAAFKRAQLEEAEDRQRKVNAEQETLKNQVRTGEQLQKIASAAKKRAELAELEAKGARKDARFSKIVSVLALLVGIGSLAVAIVVLAVR